MCTHNGEHIAFFYAEIGIGIGNNHRHIIGYTDNIASRSRSRYLYELYSIIRLKIQLLILHAIVEVGDIEFYHIVVGVNAK